jgi:citrate synthase
MEQAASNALIRPLSAYNGPAERHVEGYEPADEQLAAAERETEAE